MEHSGETCGPRQQLHLLEIVLCWQEYNKYYLSWFTEQNSTKYEQHIRSKMLFCHCDIVTKTSTITSLTGFKRCLQKEQPFPLTSMVHPGPPTSAIVASQGGQAYWITVPTGQVSVHVFHHSVRSTFCNSHRINRGGTTKAFIFFLSFSFCYILMTFPYLKPSNLVMYRTDVCTSRLQWGSSIHFPSYNFIFINRIRLP
jgi:hypothetical protein